MCGTRAAGAGGAGDSQAGGRGRYAAGRDGCLPHPRARSCPGRPWASSNCPMTPAPPPLENEFPPWRVRRTTRGLAAGRSASAAWVRGDLPYIAGGAGRTLDQGLPGCLMSVAWNQSWGRERAAARMSAQRPARRERDRSGQHSILTAFLSTTLSASCRRLRAATLRADVGGRIAGKLSDVDDLHTAAHARRVCEQSAPAPGSATEP